MPRLPPLGDFSNEISNETQMKAKWATLKNPNVQSLMQFDEQEIVVTLTYGFKNLILSQARANH
jgi:hypothetical protein